MQRGPWNSGLVQDRDAGSGNQRRLLCRLGEYRVAGRQRRRDLTGEDRKRKVPRADAHHRPQRSLFLAKGFTRLLRIVSEEINCLADFGNGVGGGFACLPHDQSHQCRHARLQQVGRLLQDGGALHNGYSRPAGSALRRITNCQPSVFLGCLDHLANDVGVITRIVHVPCSTCCNRAGQHRLGTPRHTCAREQCVRKLGQGQLIGQIDA